MIEEPLSSTTHTLEMTQLKELHDALTAPAAPRFTAEDLGITGESNGSSGPLPASAVLTDVTWDGPPPYPYVYGVFSGASGGSGGSEGQRIDLHTDALRKLSHGLRLHHSWGI
ncbi:MAG: hypothetical protein QG622_1482 [Actinomycetota bacterium]|nr:hypothetical protein [Actinomycetota bacterium]